MNHETSSFPDLDAIENGNNWSTSIKRYNRGTRVAAIHSQSSYDEEKVKKLSKYWNWIYITKDVMNNPYDDISLAYIEEMCKTFSDNSKISDKLERFSSGNVIIGEDNSDLLVISSNTKFEGGISGNVGIGTITPSALLHLSKFI